jgi:peptide/histidine transporter 3/4
MLLSLKTVFDWIVIPAAKKLTGHPSGISDLQQIGIANACAILVMLSAILVERKRVQSIKAHFTHRDYDALSRGDKTVPMTVFWLFPQYALLGFVDYLIGVAQLNFFHHETPESMRSIATSLYLVTISFGYFIFTALTRTVNARTYKASAKGGWVGGNQIFQGGLEKFYGLFAVIVGLNFIAFLVAAAKFQPKVVLNDKDYFKTVPAQKRIETTEKSKPVSNQEIAEC